MKFKISSKLTLNSNKKNKKNKKSKKSEKLKIIISKNQ